MATALKTSRNVYQQFLEFEERAAAIYVQFASRFATDGKLSSFWLEMAMHEKQHAGLMQFCLCDGQFAADLPDKTELQKLDALLKRIEKRAPDRNLTIEEALLLAIELESSEINTIHCQLTTSLHRSTYLLKRKIVTSMPDHVDELLAAARKFGVGNHALKELNRHKEHCAK
jgi:hypothetical protein